MAKVPVYFAIKLRPVVNYNLLWYFESENYILPHKLDNIFIFDEGEGFNFYQFAKIVGGNQQ